MLPVAYRGNLKYKKLSLCLNFVSMWFFVNDFHIKFNRLAPPLSCILKIFLRFSVRLLFCLRFLQNDFPVQVRPCLVAVATAHSDCTV